MEKIIDYKTIRAFEAGELDDLVNQAIKTGYQPYGTPYAFEENIFQAVVRVEERGAEN